MSKLVIIYHSFSGKTQQIAEAAAEGARGAGSKAVVFAAQDASVDSLAGATAVLIATPQTFGGMAAETKKLLERLWAQKDEIVEGLPLGVIVTHVNDTGATFALMANITGRLGFVQVDEGLALDSREMETAIEQARDLGCRLASA